MQKSAAADILRDLGRGTIPVEPDAIIARTPVPQTATFLLSLLAQAGVFPDVDVQQARFDQWCREWIASIDAQDRLLLRRYVKWGLNESWHSNLPDARRGALAKQRSRLRYCQAFLAHVRESGYTLATFPQRELDAYRTGSVAQRDALASFTAWLRRNRLSRLRVEHRKSTLQGDAFKSDHRWKMAQHFLNDPDIVAADRVAGLLVLLYGMTLSRIAGITLDQIGRNADAVSLTIGSEPIHLPPPLGEALVALIEGRDPHRCHWLFPGRNPGLPLSSGALGRRLRAHGMSTRSARVTALMELAGQMHPRVLSDLLGVSITTAAAWWRLAGGDWAKYPALR